MAAAVVAFGVSGPAFAQQIDGTSTPKQPFTACNGSYSYSVGIDVPDFRGIEPNLSLSYDFARGIRNLSGTGGVARGRLAAD